MIVLSMQRDSSQSIVMIKSSSILRLLLWNFKSSRIAKLTLIRLQIYTRRRKGHVKMALNIQSAKFKAQIYSNRENKQIRITDKK